MKGLTAKAGDSIAVTFRGAEPHPVRRGDWIKFPGMEPFAVWKFEDGQISVARGWRLLYVRMLNNPVRRMHECVVRFLGLPV